MQVYRCDDADLGKLEGKTMAVIGFGSQGHAHALNLKESGVNVIIGLYEGSKSRAVAAELGFEVMDTADAVKKAFEAADKDGNGSITAEELSSGAGGGKGYLGVRQRRQCR